MQGAVSHGFVKPDSSRPIDYGVRRLWSTSTGIFFLGMIKYAIVVPKWKSGNATLIAGIRQVNKFLCVMLKEKFFQVEVIFLPF